MKTYYIPPELHIFCFAPREQLSSLEINGSLQSVNMHLYAAASETEQQPGDVFLPITPQP